MQRIAVDMDEVIADALGELLARYNRERKTNFTKADLHGKWLWQVLPAGGQKLIEGYLQSDEFFEDLPVIPGSQKVLQRISRKYEVFIATAAMAFPNSFGAKYRWLRRHFDFLSPHNFVFCGDKSILHADFLIDDMPYNLAAFRGQGILFTSPHNANLKGYRRVDTWEDVAKIFLT
ncbi:MAG: 5'-3'-deoxyribonucleotidase [Acidobacteriaceae bacterium]